MARARVRLNGIGSGAFRPPLTTDEAGAFAFSNLPGGAYVLFADKSTYQSGRYPDAGQSVRSASRTIPLADAQQIDVTIPLYHGGAITGRIVDAHGDPVEEAMVQAIRIPRVGRSQPQFRAVSASNDLGEFRLSRLQPGRYLLLVTPRRTPPFTPPGQPVITTAPEPEPVPTFYPGVPAFDDAQPIVVDRGGTIETGDMPLVDGIVATVSGTLVDSSGQPVTRGGTVIARVVRTVPLPGAMMGASTSPVRPDGTFQLKLAAGEYDLEGRTAPSPAGRGLPAGSDQAGALRLNVAGDVSNVTIQVGRGATISGRIVFDGTTPPPSPPSAPNGPGTPIVMAAPDNDGSCRVTPPEIHADWTFTIGNVFGTCAVRAFGNLGRWSVKTVTYEGRDLIDQPMTFGPGQDLNEVEVVLTDKRTEVTFHVTDEQGTSTRDYVGLLFPMDKRKWTDSTGRYRRVLAPPPDAPPAANGGSARGPASASPPGSAAVNFSASPVALNAGGRGEIVSGVPAGEYYAIAVDDLDQESVRDPDFLEQLARAAIRIRLTEGVPGDVTLRRIPLSR